MQSFDISTTIQCLPCGRHCNRPWKQSSKWANIFLLGWSLFSAGRMVKIILVRCQMCYNRENARHYEYISPEHLAYSRRSGTVRKIHYDRCYNGRSFLGLEIPQSRSCLHHLRRVRESFSLEETLKLVLWQRCTWVAVGPGEHSWQMEWFTVFPRK